MDNHRYRAVTVPASATRPHTQSWAPTAADSLALILRGLPVSACALMVGAHPDDEDTALLAELALRHGVRAVYLSLTRGEGGQNRIGPETGAAFGILRTGELLASRMHDGAEQLLSPCVDFGYAKRAEDAFAQWGRDEVIASVVQAIREVQPDVLISVWTGTAIDGHGHHRASGIATHEAYHLAADTNAFPEQLQAGLEPWQAKRLLVRVRDETHWAEGDLHINVGQWDPILGRSCFEVAMEGRSLHRCQNMGALRTKGTQQVTYRVAAGAPVEHLRGAHALTGLPIRLDAWAEACLGGGQPTVLEAIEAASQTLAQAWESYHPQRPETTAPMLLDALRALRRAEQMLHHAESGASPQSAPGRMALGKRLQAHVQRVEAAWLQAAGIACEVQSPQPQVVAGNGFEIEATLLMRGAETVSLLSLEPDVQPGWQIECIEGPEYPLSLTEGKMAEARFRVTAPADEAAALSATLRPWLHLPSEGHLYRFPGPIPSLAPCAPPLLTVEARLQADDVQISLATPLMYREADPGFGEIRQPVRVIPRVMV
ncbi:PIG-L family deacetylase, partial [Candidatus Entotheonella palauensis]|uniref:PIG-L family deacetylase n=1 Tax=Candidatus Entotheonella palauensis TaxID=93172 RepID=UPI00117819A0